MRALGVSGLIGEFFPQAGVVDGRANLFDDALKRAQCLQVDLD